MRGSVSDLKPRTNSLKLSIQRRRMEWESGCPSAAPLSKLIMDVYGQQPMMVPELHFSFVFLTDLGTLKLASTRLIRHRVQQDTKPGPDNSGLNQYLSTMDAPSAGEQCCFMLKRQGRTTDGSVVSVVDDDESVRESLPDLLGEFGFACRTFSSAE